MNIIFTGVSASLMLVGCLWMVNRYYLKWDRRVFDYLSLLPSLLVMWFFPDKNLSLIQVLFAVVTYLLIKVYYRYKLKTANQLES